MISVDTRRINLDMKELQEHLERARAALGEEGYEKLKVALETLAYLTDLVEDKDTKISQLRRMLFGASTEKTRNVVGTVASGNSGSPTTAPVDEKDTCCPETQPGDAAQPSPAKKAKGHGRNGAAAYTGAKHIHVEHGSLKPGQRCPKCTRGKIYRCKEPALLVRITGQAPLQATIYELERWRCNLCGEVFTAEAPKEVGPAKWDEAAASMVALLKYGTGLPFYRLEQLQKSLGIPLPASTQWEMVSEAAEAIEPAWKELIKQAAQGEVFHNDDTKARILELIRERRKRELEQGFDPKERTGTFTTGVVSIIEGRKIALFFTGPQHAGENLRDILLQRAAGLAAPIQMCDGLDRNIPDLPDELKVILSNCTVHMRRQFVDVANRFPQECRYVLEALRDIYHNDAVARRQEMSPAERLAFHKAKSGPRMEDLRRWMAEQLDEKKVEPNSGLGDAIAYTQKRWDRLTRFLEVPGAPLDNNAAERILKKAILSRKNSYFYKTAKGARAGDMFMSLIHTTELANANPFNYLTELLKHAKDVACNPERWMPWNYRDTLGQTEPTGRLTAADTFSLAESAATLADEVLGRLQRER
jgi:transposase